MISKKKDPPMTFRTYNKIMKNRIQKYNLIKIKKINFFKDKLHMYNKQRK